VIHRGEIIEQYIRKHRLNLSKLAESMPWTVKTMYRHFKEPYLHYDRVLEYARVLGYDFHKEMPELKAFNWLLREPEEIYQVSPSKGENEAEFYRKKYEETLEKYNDMLERYNLLLQGKVTQD